MGSFAETPAAHLTGVKERLEQFEHGTLVHSDTQPSAPI